MLSGMTVAGTYSYGYDPEQRLQSIRLHGVTVGHTGGVGGLLSTTLSNPTMDKSYFPCAEASGNITEYISESGAVAWQGVMRLIF